MRAWILAPLVVVALSNGALGQARISFGVAPATVPTVQAPATVAPANTTASQAATASATDATLKQQRLQKFKQLQFDRRPSTILKAWLEFSKEQKKAAEKQEKEATAAPTEGAPAPDTKPEEPATEAQENAAPQKEQDQEEEDKQEDETPAESNESAESGDDADSTASETSDAKEVADDDAQAKAAAKKAEEEKKKALAAKKKAEQEKNIKELDAQLKDFQRDVTLGRWTEVQTYLAGLDEEEAKALYARLLDCLRTGPARGAANPALLQQMVLDSADRATMQSVLSSTGQGPGAAFIEKNQFAMADVAGLVKAAPDALDTVSFNRLGMILRLTLAAGHDLDELLRELAPADDAGETADDAEPRPGKRDVARLLCASGQEARAGDFLPSLEEASQAADAQALNLLARHFLAQHDEESKTAHLESAWQATQAVLAIDPPPDEQPAEDEPAAADKEPTTTEQDAEQNTDEKPVEKTPEEKAAEEAKQQREELRGEIASALSRAVELAPRLKKELGAQWLDESFSDRIDRGREILVTLGTQVSQNLQSRPTNAESRLKSLELQRTAVESLLRAAPEKAADWQDTLTLLAANWLKEADASYRLDNRQQFGQQWRRDRYGNYYFIDDPENASPYRYQNGNQAQPIPIEDVLEARPRQDWLALVDADLKPKFATILSQLHLKAGEDAEAFPYIEQLAPTHAEQAHDLAEEFLRVWTRNHNPNEKRSSSPYMYYWGYEQRADRIPLTRSKQERNLEELGGWVRRLRALPIGELDEQLLAKAFTTSHSKAEIYRLEAIEEVFGSLDNLEPRTIAELIQQMRGNLAGVWRLPDVQKKNNTNRKQRDIQAEVRRGYELSLTVVRQALEKHPDHWALVMAEAAVLHDQNDFRQEIEKFSKFSERRQEALARYRRAAELYAAAVTDMTEEEQTPYVYEQWFYAGLGAVDLERVTADKVPDDRQPAYIREAITSLPGEIGSRHLEEFANHLFIRARSAKPELKYRYLKSGFEIVGDHKMAREARKLLDYYADLVHEIKLQAVVDGSDTVGHEEPFGVFVNIRHTKEIERESGGFGRYLQNQNSNQYYYYNFGRPTQNYRDKFRDTVTQAIGEQFDVLSVTFQEPDVNSKADEEYGWRITPYAYLLLKARGPEVDKIAPCGSISTFSTPRATPCYRSKRRLCRSTRRPKKCRPGRHPK